MTQPARAWQCRVHYRHARDNTFRVRVTGNLPDKHCSGQLHAIVAKMDAGERQSRQATGGFGDREMEFDQSLTGPTASAAPVESTSSPAIKGSSNFMSWTSRARGAMIGDGTLSRDSIAYASFNGQLQKTKTLRRLAKQV